VRPVIEPASGDKLGTVGFAALSDLERSALRAREAQVAWAAALFSERATVMRRAAELWKNHSDDIQSWLIRESGDTRAKTTRELHDAVNECLEASALPSHALGEVLPSEKALHVLPGGGDIGSALVTDANVQAVSFSGSTKAGQSVGELGGRHFTRVQLELGGNNALIVMDDADLDRTVAAAARGSFFNAGQGCMVIGRHLVHESIYDEYVGKLAATAGGLTVGNPPPTTSTWARSSTNASGTRSTRWSPAASRQAPRCAPAAPTTGSSTAPLSSPAPVPARPHTTTRSSAPSPRSSLSPRPAKPSIWHQTVSTASTSAS